MRIDQLFTDPAVASEALRYLTLIEKNARDCREAMSEAREIAIEAAKAPRLSIAKPAALNGVAGKIHAAPSESEELAADARGVAGIAVDRLQKLVLISGRLQALLGRPAAVPTP